MFNFFSKNKEKKLALSVQAFAHANKNLLIIVGDPKTDNLFVGYKDFIVSGKIKSADGKSMDVVKGVLNNSQFKKSIDPFLVGILEVLQLPMKAGNQFYQFLDGALFNIARALRRVPPEGSIKSPFYSTNTPVETKSNDIDT